MKKLFVFLSCSVVIIAATCKNNYYTVTTSSDKCDSSIVMQHLQNITKTDGFRNYQNIPLLNKTADYILSVFQQYADTAYFQPYKVGNSIYKNVVCRFKGADPSKPLVVVGAHYDVCGNQEGADDNASGVTGLLELARLLASNVHHYPIELVAYCLEEPPFFRTEHMGSYIHANSLFTSAENVYGMIALEMIGYFKDTAKSQSYPVKVMKVAYGNKGDYVLLAQQTGAGKFVNNFSSGFKEMASIETKSIKAPAKMQGIDFSDHLNYWKFGYDALMVTNTAFYRNHNYHKPTDRLETLNIPQMMNVINSVLVTLINLNEE